MAAIRRVTGAGTSMALTGEETLDTGAQPVENVSQCHQRKAEIQKFANHPKQPTGEQMIDLLHHLLVLCSAYCIITLESRLVDGCDFLQLLHHPILRLGFWHFLPRYFYLLSPISSPQLYIARTVNKENFLNCPEKFFHFCSQVSQQHSAICILSAPAAFLSASEVSHLQVLSYYM